MAVRGVIWDEVEDDPDPATMGVAEKSVDVIKSAKDRVNGAVVQNVVAKIDHR